MEQSNVKQCLPFTCKVFMYICVACGQVCVCVCGGLGQERRMLAFIIRVQGSPLASAISQICPKAARQAEREEGGNERTDGNTEMPRSQLT